MNSAPDQSPDIDEMLSVPLALFLDFDGTLVDIAPSPDLVDLPDADRDTLARLSGALGGAFAIISGRDLDDLDDHLHPLKPAAAGTHGISVRDGAGAVRTIIHDDATLADVAARSQSFCERHPGLRCEVKQGAVAIHFRARPDLEEECRAFVADLIAGSDLLEPMAGKMVLEMKLTGASKGKAVASLMDQPPFHGRRPVFAGDDTTDETAFAEVNRRGGISIKIGEGRTVARHRMPDTGTLWTWLRELAVAAEGRLGQ
jgi:trehalose 6-phosphate phosphatase